MDIEQLLKDYTPLLKNLAHYPFQIGVKVPVSGKHQRYIYQELKVRFIELCHDYDPKRGTRFPGYIKGNLQWTAHHLIEKLKEEDNMVFIDPKIIEETVANTVVEDIDFSDEISFAMEHLINQLPKRQRLVIYEHFVLGYDLKYIAERLEINITNVYEYKRLGLDKLREMAKDGL